MNRFPRIDTRELNESIGFWYRIQNKYADFTTLLINVTKPAKEGKLASLTDVIIPSENISQLHYSKSQNLDCPTCGNCDRTCDNCEYCGTN